MKNAVGIGIGSGASVAIVILIFVMMNGTGIGEVADSATMKVDYNRNAKALDFIFNFYDKDGNFVKADGKIIVTLIYRDISEEIIFKKNEFVATQNEFGTKIIELRKSVPVREGEGIADVFKEMDLDPNLIKMIKKSSILVSVIIETGGNELSFEPKEVSVL